MASKKSAAKAAAQENTDRVDQRPELQAEVELGPKRTPQEYREMLAGAGSDAIEQGNLMGCHYAAMTTMKMRMTGRNDVLNGKKAGPVVAASLGVTFGICRSAIEEGLAIANGEQLPHDLRRLGLNLAANQLLLSVAVSHALKDLCEQVGDDEELRAEHRRLHDELATRINKAGEGIADMVPEVRGALN